jgi:flagellar protein FlaG
MSMTIERSAQFNKMQAPKKPAQKATIKPINNADQVVEKIKVQAKQEEVQYREAIDTPTTQDMHAELTELADKINKGVKAFSDEINFTYDKGLEQMVVTVFDGATGKVVKQLPSKEMLAFRHKIRNAIEGALLDERS